MVEPKSHKVGQTRVNRQFMVNYLSNVVLLQELRDRGVLAPATPFSSSSSLSSLPLSSTPRVIYISSGCYHFGTVSKLGVTEDYGLLQASTAYGQSKFLTQVHEPSWMGIF